MPFYLDHPYHGIEILGGMWGMHNSVNRDLGSKIFSLLMDSSVCLKYNQNGNSPKMNDQYFLREKVYRLVVNQAVVHDSYTCRQYANSQPFPTQRIIMDHVGSVKRHNNLTKTISVCPKECRPPDHQDWTYC